MPRFLFAGCVALFGLAALTSAAEVVVCGPAPVPYAVTCWSQGTFQYSTWGKCCDCAAQTHWRPSLPPPPCPVQHCGTCMERIDGKPVQAELLPLPRVEEMK